MALLSTGWAGVALFPGAERLLAAQAGALPQTDQFCGPFAAWVALHGVMEAPPSIVDLAVACGTQVWPHDVPAWRPVGAPFRNDGWSAVPEAADPEASGTDAAGVLQGLATLCDPSVQVEQRSGPDWSGLDTWLAELARSSRPVAVIANVRTGPVAPAETPWDVGHFVVLVGLADDGRVAVADSYVELGDPDAPPGCRLVRIDALRDALAAPPGRSLFVLRSSVAHGSCA